MAFQPKVDALKSHRTRDSVESSDCNFSFTNNLSLIPQLIIHYLVYIFSKNTPRFSSLSEPVLQNMKAENVLQKVERNGKRADSPHFREAGKCECFTYLVDQLIINIFVNSFQLIS